MSAKITRVLKENRLIVAVACIYLTLFLLMPIKASQALGNSVYYLIEMFQVLPIIFLLTVVIEALIPKEMILKHFGEGSGIAGSIYALILGSISAGPIYAAFPICKMLLKKGASVPNIVIILSSWAVIKLPMLANEAKFLGLKFMAIRWGLTVVAILGMAWLIGKLISQKEMVSEEVVTESNFEVSQTYCMGCGICSKLLPEVFEIVERKAQIKVEATHSSNEEQIKEVAQKCPVQAIVVSFE